MRKFKLILFISLICKLNISFAQQIIQLGIKPGGANFVIKYHQNRVINSTVSGIEFVDVSNPASPTIAATLSPPANFPMAIQVENNYAYFGGGMVGYFMIADITNINAPFITGITYQIGGTGYQIAIKGNYAFMPINADTLYSIDISNKTNPFVANKIYIGGQGVGISIRGNYAYVGTNVGLKVVDISTPTNMTVSSNIIGNYNNISEDTLNKRIFVAKNSGGFEVMNVTNPANPSLLFQGSGGGSGANLVYKNGFVFQKALGNVCAFQIGAGSANYLGSYSTTIGGQINSVSAKDSVFYLSSTTNLYIFKLGTAALPLSVNKLNEIDSPNIFPNPNNGIFNLQIPNTIDNGQLILINLLGQKLFEQTVMQGNSEITITGLAKGLYHFMILQNKIQLTNGKIVIE